MELAELLTEAGESQHCQQCCAAVLAAGASTKLTLIFTLYFPPLLLARFAKQCPVQRERELIRCQLSQTPVLRKSEFPSSAKALQCGHLSPSPLTQPLKAEQPGFSY